MTHAWGMETLLTPHPTTPQDRHDMAMTNGLGVIEQACWTGLDPGFVKR